MAAEPNFRQIDATRIEKPEGAYYLILKADIDWLQTYINALRLAFQENLISLKKCAGQ